MARAALTQGCDPLTLTGYLWPQWRVWTQDADRSISDERLIPLSNLSGISVTAFQRAMLMPVASRISSTELDRMAIWPWVLTLGTRNTKRRSGLQYCPTCLMDDADPYYRLQWRFAWHTGCERHGASLLDRCWKCEAPLEPHRLKAGDMNVATCATCKADLRNAQVVSCSGDAFRFQQEADRSVLYGQASFLGSTVSVTEWFRLADFFVSLARRSGHSYSTSLMELMKQIGNPAPLELPPIVGSGLELLRSYHRQQLLGSAWRFFVSTQAQLLGTLKTSGITRQGFCGETKHVPESLADLVNALPDKPKSRSLKFKARKPGPRPRHEVIRMMARLERKLEMTRRCSTKI